MKTSTGEPAAHALARYRCFLPDLAGLAGLRRAGPGAINSSTFVAGTRDIGLIPKGIALPVETFVPQRTQRTQRRRISISLRPLRSVLCATTIVKLPSSTK